jgi:hypothetical protein
LQAARGYDLLMGLLRCMWFVDPHVDPDNRDAVYVQQVVDAMKQRHVRTQTPPMLFVTK